MNIDENVQKVIKLLLRKWKLLILFIHNRWLRRVFFLTRPIVHLH